MLGQANLLRVLTKIAKTVDGDGTTEGLQKVGEMISGDAKREATSMGVVDSGRLRGSLTYSIDGKQYGFEDKVEENKQTDQVDRVNSNKEVHIGTNVEYAKAQEFGSIKSPTGRPFLTKSYTHNRDEAIKILGKNIKTSITRGVMK